MSQVRPLPPEQYNRQMKTYPIVEVDWLDAIETHVGEWVEPKAIKNKPMPSKTVGYLVRDSKEAITVMALKNDNHLGLGITIPRAMVTDIRYL